MAFTVFTSFKTFYEEFRRLGEQHFDFQAGMISNIALRDKE